jgi:hypothetical protein
MAKQLPATAWLKAMHPLKMVLRPKAEVAVLVPREEVFVLLPE